MKSSRQRILTLTVSALALSSLSGCTSSKWQSKFDEGQKSLAQKPAKLEADEHSFKAAIDDAEIHRVPEPRFAAAFAALGTVLSEEGKFAEAQPYLIKAASLATATHMSAAENVRLLKLLSASYEGTKNYKQAVQTQDVLTNFIESELSPSSAEYKQATATTQRLKQLMNACAASGEDCCEMEHKTATATPTPTPAGDLDAALQLPGND